MSMTLKLNIVQNSQNVTGNSSNVTVSAIATWDAKHWNASGLCTGSITIDGTTYSFSGMSFNTNATSSGSQTVMTKTVDVKHLENGSKTLVCSASFDTHVSVGVISASASKNLTTIARKATLTETPSLTLGEQGTLKISNPSTDIARIVTYVCRTASGLILDEPGKYANSINEGTKASETEISWTPPIDLASIDPTSEYASITITIESVLDSSGHGQYDTPLGTNTYYIKAKVPDSVVPTVNSITVTETVVDQYLNDEFTNGNGTYKYVQGVSVLKVSIAASGSYGSAIKSYSTTIGGVTYTGSEFLVDTSNLSGTVEINTTVTDNRGSSGRKSASKTTSVSIQPYSPPKITSFTAVRANSDCTANSNGDYMLYRFAGTWTNIFPYVNWHIRHKKRDETTWTDDFSATATGGVLTEDNTEDVIGPLEQSAYDIQLEIADAWNSVSQTITGPTTAPIIHFNNSGTGIGFGKVAELDNVLDIGFQTKFTGGILYPTLEAGKDLDAVLTPNTYSGLDQSSANYLNCPLTSGSFTLEVKSAGADGQLLQRLTRCHKTQPVVYERFYYEDTPNGEKSWGAWIDRGWTDPDWITIDKLGDSFKSYDNKTQYMPRYRKDGRTVEINGQLQPTSAIEHITNGSFTSRTMFTLPEGYRPTSNIHTLCQGSGMDTWLLIVATNGNCVFTRYRCGNTGATAGTTCWLPFQLTFLV